MFKHNMFLILLPQAENLIFYCIFKKMVYDEVSRESKQKGKTMKKFVLLSLIASMFSTVAMADMYRESVSDCDEAEMRAALDRATRDNRAVITVVECDNGIVRTTTKPAPRVAKPEYKTCGCATCGCETKEEVVKREYFVRETVQQYKPVVQYVPSGTYTRVKPTCNHGC